MQVPAHTVIGGSESAPNFRRRSSGTESMYQREDLLVKSTDSNLVRLRVGESG